MTRSFFSRFFSWYRYFIQGKTRIISAWIFVVFLPFLVQNSLSLKGVVLCFLGSVIRFWASGYLRKDTGFTFEGPYAWTRNPLYLGTYFMAMGTLLSLQAYKSLFCFMALFFCLYHFIILDEEIKLMKLFGKSYETYLTLVARFFPTSFPLTSAQKHLLNPYPEQWQHFSWRIALKNKAFESFFSFIGIYTFLCLILWIKHRRLF